jgi:hypothetical protein
MSIGSFLSGLPWGDIGKGAFSMFGAMNEAKGAKRAAQQATPSPYSVFGPAGGFYVDPRTKQISLNMAANPFASMFNALGASSFANAATAPGQFLHGANPEIAKAYKGLFGQGLTDRIQGQYDLLSQIAAPGENRAALALDDQLFSRGQTGTSGGAEQERAQAEAFSMADLQRQLAATGLGRQEAMDRFGGAMQAVGQGMAGQNQAFNMGMGAFGGMQGLFQNLMNQGQLGMAGMSGAPWQASMGAAQAAQAPWQAGYNVLNQSGIFDKLNGLFKGGGGGDARTPGFFDPSQYYG